MLATFGTPVPQRARLLYPTLPPLSIPFFHLFFLFLQLLRAFPETTQHLVFPSLLSTRLPFPSCMVLSAITANIQHLFAGRETRPLRFDRRWIVTANGIWRVRTKKRSGNVCKYLQSDERVHRRVAHCATDVVSSGCIPSGSPRA